MRRYVLGLFLLALAFTAGLILERGAAASPQAASVARVFRFNAVEFAPSAGQLWRREPLRSSCWAYEPSGDGAGEWRVRIRTADGDDLVYAVEGGRAVTVCEGTIHLPEGATPASSP